MVELEPERGAARPAAVHGPLAAAAVALPDATLHLGGDSVLCRGTRHRGWRGTYAASLAMALDEQVEPRLDDCLHARPGMGMGERLARQFDLGEEPLRDGDVEAAELGVEGDDRRSCISFIPFNWGPDRIHR